MAAQTVLIVEDDFLIAMVAERTLEEAGYRVCGIATSEEEAIAVAERELPSLAMVDISLAPGDGRVVARTLAERLGVSVLFATSQCTKVETRGDTGAIACIPKPYDAEYLPAALRFVDQVAKGHDPGDVPDHMFKLV